MDGIIRTGVVFFCHDGAGKYLISKRSKNARDEHETWDPGGGGLKFGETIEDAVHREVQEEYCTRPLQLEFMGYRDVFRTQKGIDTHWVMFDFRVSVNSVEVAIGEPHKCDAIRWITLDDLIEFGEPLHSQFPDFLERYKHHL